MKKLLLTMLFFVAFFASRAQSNLEVNGFFSNQDQPVVNEKITIIYFESDSIATVIGYDTVYTDSTGYYTSSMPSPDPIFQGYAILSTTDCYGRIQELFALFLPGYVSPPVNFECINYCENSFGYTVDSVPGIGLYARFGVTTYRGTTQYNWTFGDGSTASGAYVDHVYSLPGVYTVCVTTSDSLAGCTQTYCDSVIIQEYNYDCFATFTYSQDSVNANTIYFNGQTGNAPGSIITFDFGDGYVQTGSNNVTHVYDQPGIYTVCLGYFDIFQNCFTTYCDIVYVGSGLISNCTAEYKMFMIPDSVTQGANVIYFSNVYQSPTSTYSWDFGDGNYGYGPYVTHLYNGFGLYDVCSYIFDPIQNCMDTVCKRIEILEGGMKVLGVDKVENISINKIYPNPTDDLAYLNLNSSYEGQATINIMGIDGRLITQFMRDVIFGDNTLELDLSAYEKGIYLVEIISDKDRAVSKLMVK
jgi:Secretion system C-terminal sorting domain/PKD domain